MEQLSANGTHRAGPGDRKPAQGDNGTTVTQPGHAAEPSRGQRSPTPAGKETRTDPQRPQSSGSAAPGSPQPTPAAPAPPAPPAHRQPSTRCPGSRRPAREEGRAQPGCGGRERPGAPAGLPSRPVLPRSAEGLFHSPNRSPRLSLSLFPSLFPSHPVPFPFPAPLTAQRRHFSAALHATSARGAPAKGSGAAPPQRSGGKHDPAGGEFRRHPPAPRRNDPKTDPKKIPNRSQHDPKTDPRRAGLRSRGRAGE